MTDFGKNQRCPGSLLISETMFLKRFADILYGVVFSLGDLLIDSLIISLMSRMRKMTWMLPWLGRTKRSKSALERRLYFADLRVLQRLSQCPGLIMR